MQQQSSQQNLSPKMNKVINPYLKKQQWQSFSKTFLKNKAKAKLIKFENKYRQYVFQKRRKSFQLSTNTNLHLTSNDINLSIPSLRKMVKQKHQQQDNLRKTINQYKFHLLEKQRSQRAFKIAQLKFKKIITVRQNHLKDIIQLNKNKAQNQEQIKQQKQKQLSLTKSLKNSRVSSLQKSKIQKRSIAELVRVQSQQNKLKLYQTQVQSLKYMRKKCQLQKSQQKIKQLKVFQVKQIKRVQADKIRKRRLYTEMNERDIVHQQRLRFNQKTQKKIDFMKTITDNLNKKIQQYKIFSKQIYPHRKGKSMSVSTQI